MVQVHHLHSAIEVLVVQGGARSTCTFYDGIGTLKIDVLRCTTGTFGYRSKVCAYVRNNVILN